MVPAGPFASWCRITLHLSLMQLLQLHQHLGLEQVHNMPPLQRNMQQGKLLLITRQNQLKARWPITWHAL